MFSKMFGVKITTGAVDDSTIPENRRLVQKFDQHILNYNVNPELRIKIREALYDKTTSLFWGFYTKTTQPEYECQTKKNHVRTYKDLEGWMIKFHRQDLDVGEDAFLYRVRKSHKIQAIITQRGWSELAVVPKKYLYYHPQSDKWFVVAEKLGLYDKNYLTATQAALIAVIVFEALLLDIHWGNIKFDSKGRVAFCDTEPPYRKFQKKIKNSTLVKSGLIEYSLFKQTLALLSSNRLIFMTSSRQNMRAVQWAYLSKSMKDEALKIAVLSALIYFMPAYPPVSSFARFALAVKIMALAGHILLNFIIFAQKRIV